MSSSPDNFDQLKELLGLKRFEQPPPGFFTHFSDKVMARIEAEGLRAGVSWWRKLFVNLEAQALLACAYGVMVGGLLVVGMIISRTAELEQIEESSATSAWFTATPVLETRRPAEPVAQQFGNSTELSSSVTPVVSSAPSPFFEVPRLKTEQISFPVR